MGTGWHEDRRISPARPLSVAVVTDNDGDVAGLEKKYADYIKENKKDKITICYDQVEDTGTLKIGEKPYNYNTLEPKILKANGNNITLFNSILGTDYSTIEDLQKYMKHHKTETALAIFNTNEEVVFPAYIMEAIRNE